MATFSQFRPYVQPEVVECPVVLVDDAVREGCRAFSAVSHAIRTDLPQAIVAGTSAYTLAPPAEHEVFALHSVFDGDDTELAPMAESAYAKFAGDDGTPQRFWFNNGDIHLYPNPVEDDALDIEAVIRPTQSAATVDDRYLEHRLAVTAHAKYRLMSMANVSWANPTEAAKNWQLFLSETAKFRARVAVGSTQASLRVVPNFF